MDDYLGSLVNRIGRVLWHESADALGAVDVTPRVFGLLDRLDELGPMSQARLCRHSGIDRTTMVAIVDDLEDRVLVERRRDPSDRRAYLVALTPAGHALVQEHRESLLAIEDKALSVLSKEDASALKSMLAQVAAAIDPRIGEDEQHSAGPAPPDP